MHTNNGADIGSALLWSPMITLLGLLFSIPWFACLLLAIWFAGAWLTRHIYILCIAGPMLVCGSWYAMAATDFLDVVAMACVVSSALVVAMHLGCSALARRRQV